MLLLVSWFLTPSCHTSDCDPSDQPDKCTSDRTAVWECSRTEGQPHLSTTIYGFVVQRCIG
jgi:hypothetical protein